MRVGAGRRSHTRSCTVRAPRNSLIWGVKATSTRSPAATPAAAAVLEKKMASRVRPPRESFSFRCRPPPTSAQADTVQPDRQNTGLGLPAP